ncbi:MAG TPA: Asp-tRNA(Asn)/Glu-tRNA(Gln) amidotransferase subunit GatA [Candidatus Krumholzibacteria bacterium]|nr:Asp-tRNA(Asn)/Glu-tRNA(Gln) amidotransferase subunit GatA [Candidatus Krumholzibacteria bacterium]
MSLYELSIAELRRRIASGEVTPLEATDAALSQIDARDRDVHAFLDVHGDRARERAKALATTGVARTLPLAGVPIAIKDNMCVEGTPTTCGSKILGRYQPPYTATAVARLEDAGAIVVGKTNLDEFAMGSSTENSAFGPTRNPWDLSRAPGGSSGGSAAAVSAGMAAAALGSDTGGSIRQPAALCGVVGMKPTYGRVSRYGLVAFASSLDQIGPFARSVEDAALILNALCGKDSMDASSAGVAVPDFTNDLAKGLKGLRIGIPWEFLGPHVDPAVRKSFDTTIDAAKREGADIVDVALPNADFGLAAYYIVANAEASANLARFDGIRYGHRSPRAQSLYETYAKTREEGFGREVKRRVLLGTYVLSAGYYDAYYRRAQQVRSLIIKDFATAFERCDVVALPTSPTPAFKLGDKTDDPILMYLNDVFTIPVNLAGLPGISVPCGMSPERLPIGLQLIGRAFDETKLLRAAAGMERVADFPTGAVAPVSKGARS